jgi:hypothetical protein
VQHHSIRAGKLDKSKELLTSLRFVEAMCALGLAYNLFYEYEAFLKVRDCALRPSGCSSVDSPMGVIVNAALLGCVTD